MVVAVLWNIAGTRLAGETRKIVDVSRGRNSKLGAALVDIMEWEIL